MLFRILLIIFALSCLLGGQVRALEPVQSETYLMEMIRSVGTGKRVFALPSTQSPQKRYGHSLTAIPISAIGQARAAAASGTESASKHARPAYAHQSVTTGVGPSKSKPVATHARTGARLSGGLTALPTSLERILGAPLGGPRRPVRPARKPRTLRKPRVTAKALVCLDLSSNKVVFARNISEPMPIASITKLLTAMTIIDEMKLDGVIRVPDDIRRVHRHRVGIRPGDLLTAGDLLHGMLIESGNDCAEALARAYPRGGRTAFLEMMNRKAALIGANRTVIHTPSGLDMDITLGRIGGRTLLSKRPNVASAEDVARIAQAAFKYPMIRRISSMKRYTMHSLKKKGRKYVLRSNDRLLDRPLPVAGAKTGYTNLAGRCIVALFKDKKKAKDYMVVVLNSRHHFRDAERIYRWACKAF